MCCRPASAGSLDPFAVDIAIPDSVPASTAGPCDEPFYFATIELETAAAAPASAASSAASGAPKQALARPQLLGLPAAPAAAGAHGEAPAPHQARALDQAPAQPPAPPPGASAHAPDGSSPEQLCPQGPPAAPQHFADARGGAEAAVDTGNPNSAAVKVNGAAGAEGGSNGASHMAGTKGASAGPGKCSVEKRRVPVCGCAIC